MDQSANPAKSAIPRFSRLPQPPRPSLRPSPSKESLSSTSTSGIAAPRLRNHASQDQMRATAQPRRQSANAQARATSTSLNTLNHKKSIDTGLKRPLGPATTRQNGHQATASLQRRSIVGGAVADKHPERRTQSVSENLPQSVQKETETDVGVGLEAYRSPSLSERTMETLAYISPAPNRRRGSNFFNSESPMRSVSRGSSSKSGSRPTSRDEPGAMNPPFRSFSSRSSTSSGPKASGLTDFRSATNTYKASESPNGNTFSPIGKPPMGTKRLSHKPSQSRLQSPGSRMSNISRSPSPEKGVSIPPASKPAGTSYPVRALKSKPSVNGLLRKPSTQMRGPTTEPTKPPERISRPPSKLVRAPAKQPVSKKSTPATSVAPPKPAESSEASDAASRNSSAVLREQIAKAKAAKRAQMMQRKLPETEEVPVIPTDSSFDFGLNNNDPFNLAPKGGDNKGLLRKRVDAARTDGRLNIAAMGLKEIPAEVMNMYNLESMDGSWAESVDLTRFVAADNEFEVIGDDFFPDVDPRDVDYESSNGNQFGGLETLDLRGNLLRSLPLGLRRLEQLTTLNLSNNKLDGDALEVVCQISSLRDFRMANNNLTGQLSTSISNLTNLEVLDIRTNSLTTLPDGLSELVRLRILNIAENKFSSLPFETLHRLPLIEIFAAKNKLEGTLMPAEVSEMPHLQILDVTCNALTSLAETEVLLPSLHQLNCSSNRLSSIPDVTSWVSLRTFTAEDNKIASLPEGFVTLRSLRNADFTGNDIRTIPDEIALMDDLSIFRISANPLREKKFSSLSTEELKNTLKARMAPAPDVSKVEARGHVVEGSNGSVADFDFFHSAPTSPAATRQSSSAHPPIDEVAPSSRPTSSHWPVKQGTILDRSDTRSSSLDAYIAQCIASTHTIRTIELQHNSFSEFPVESLSFFADSLTTLNLAHNDLASDSYLNTKLELPMLKELDLSANAITTLAPLLENLHAPVLEKLNISFNRLTSLAPLRASFPELKIVLASNNALEDVLPEEAEGLRVLDVSNNDIASLNPRLGLLGGEGVQGGLEKFDVSGNRFRVPRYDVVAKGTGAVLAWLRLRIPNEELGETY